MKVPVEFIEVVCGSEKFTSGNVKVIFYIKNAFKVKMFNIWTAGFGAPRLKNETLQRTSPFVINKDTILS